MSSSTSTANRSAQSSAQSRANRTASSFLTIAIVCLLLFIVAAGVASKDPAFQHWMQHPPTWMQYHPKS